jgi:hypothetical protein
VATPTATVDPFDLDVAEAMTAEEGWEEALAGEVGWSLTGDGTLVRAEDDERQGRAWTPDSGSGRRP